jgi:hypothetical protein
VWFAQKPSFLDDAKRVAGSVEGAWWNFEQCAESMLDAAGGDVHPSGGCILMRCALGDLSEASPADWETATEAAIWNLSAAHAMGVYHCDIRASNFLHFDDGWQLADWGLACVSGGTVRIGRNTSQGRRVGCRVRHLLEKADVDQDDISVEWCIADDWEMLSLMPYVGY